MQHWVRWFRRRPRSQQVHDHLRFWSEKLPLALAMLAQSLVVTRWYIGSHAPVPVPDILTWANVVVAVAAGLALDLVVVTTVMARRDGRRSWWGVATAGAAALASALIALEVYGAWTPQPWLHVAYPVVVFLFSMHLSSPRDVAPNRPLLAQRRTLIVRLVRLLREVRTDLHTQAQVVAQLRMQAAQREQDHAHAQQGSVQQVAQLRSQIAHAERAAAQHEGEVARLREQLAQREQEVAALAHTPPPVESIDLTAIAQRLKERGTSWRDLEDLLHIPQSTLRARLQARGKVRTNGQLVEA